MLFESKLASCKKDDTESVDEKWEWKRTAKEGNEMKKDKMKEWEQVPARYVDKYNDKQMARIDLPQNESECVVSDVLPIN